MLGTNKSKTSISSFVGTKILQPNVWNAFKRDTSTKIKRIEGLCEEADDEAKLAVSERQDYHLENITAKLDAHVLTEGSRASQAERRNFS